MLKQELTELAETGSASLARGRVILPRTKSCTHRTLRPPFTLRESPATSQQRTRKRGARGVPHVETHLRVRHVSLQKPRGWSVSQTPIPSQGLSLGSRMGPSTLHPGAHRTAPGQLLTQDHLRVVYEITLPCAHRPGAPPTWRAHPDPGLACGRRVDRAVPKERPSVLAPGWHRWEDGLRGSPPEAVSC